MEEEEASTAGWPQQSRYGRGSGGKEDEAEESSASSFKHIATRRMRGVSFSHSSNDSARGSFSSSFGSTLPAGHTEEEEHLLGDPMEIERMSEPKFSQYDEFTTIDWIRESVIDRRNRSANLRLPNTGWNIVKKLFYGVQAWIFVALVGISTGFFAGIIDMGVEWMSGIKFGICSTNFTLSRELCCRNSEECDEWKTWRNVAGVSDDTAAYLLEYCMYTAFAVIFASVSAWFVFSLSKWAAGSGIPEVKTILSGFVITMFNSPQTLAVKSVGLVLSVSSGLNLGKEGPLVHVACCIVECWIRLFPRYFKNQAKKREIISAAAACGVSVAFGAPIGGVLFSLEEVSYYFPHKTMWRAFFGATIAALTLEFMDPLHTGKIVLFKVTYSTTWKTFELLPFILIAVMGGLIGAFFIKLNIRVCRFRKGSPLLKRFAVFEVMVVAGITALIQYLNIYTRVDTAETIGKLFSQCQPGEDDNLCNLDRAGMTVLFLLLACLVKFVLTIFTFGLRIPAGLFIPSLAIGALMGRAVGIGVDVLHKHSPDLFFFRECGEVTQCVTPGVYALVGAAAVLSGVTRMTVSLVVIVFELTGELNYILPIMFAVMISKWVSDSLGKEGIYDQHIALNRYPFLDNKARLALPHTIAHIMKADNIVVIESNSVHTVESLEHFLDSNEYNGYPIVNRREEMLLVGYIARKELRQALASARVTESVTSTSRCYFQPMKQTLDLDASIDMRPWMDVSPLQLSPQTPLNVVSDLFQTMGFRYLVVTRLGRMIGICTRKDLLNHIARTENKEPRRYRKPKRPPTIYLKNNQAP
ncbi:Chloride channel protein [Balamuthia mandrillaris]